jgi:DNA-binding NtrC family response regulator
MTDARPSVLIVDDQPELLRVFQRGLEGAGYCVTTADTAEAAMLMIDAEPPDALLVDLKMPYINGMGMLYRLRKAHRRLPVAIITGVQNLDRESLQEIAMLDAVVHYKPITIPQMVQVVNDLLARPSA